MRVLCKKCKRFLFETENTVILKSLKCGGCKTKQDIRIITTKTSKQEREKKAKY